MTGLLLDFRLALRALARRPLLSVLMVLTLGLGFGASTAIYSYVEATVLDPLPFPDADRLVFVSGVFVEDGGEPQVRGASVPEVADWQRLSSSFETLAATWNRDVTVTLGGAGERVAAAFVEPGHLALMGVEPVIGRTLTAADDAPPGGLPVALLGHGLWSRHFAGDRDVLGTMLEIDGGKVEVVGVLPAGFQDTDGEREIWLPLRQAVDLYGMGGLFDSRGGRWLGVTARLRPGVGVEAAQAEMDAIAADLEREHPDTHLDRSALVQSFEEGLVGDPQRRLVLLLGAVGLVWLLSCVNVASLMVARLHERTREVAVRASLGASRARLFGGMVIESLMLGAGGAVLGLLLSSWGVQALQATNPLGLPGFVEVEVGTGVMAFAVALAVVSGLLVAMLGALRLLRPDLTRSLKAGGEALLGRVTGGRAIKTQNVLVVVQVAAALVVVVGAGLVTRSLLEQRAIDPGFEAEGLLALRVQAPPGLEPERREAFGRALLDGVGEIPGVDSAALSTDLLLSGGSSATYAGSEADVTDPDRRTRVYYHFVSGDFFRTLGIDVEGAGFSPPTTGGDGPTELVVDEALARRLWPGEEAVGQELVVGSGDPAVVVGVAEEARFRQLVPGPLDSTDPDVYLSYFPGSSSTVGVVLRLAPAGDGGVVEAVLPRVRDVVRRLAPEAPVYDVATVEELLSREVADSRFTSQIFAGFALLALVLAGLGVYGVMAYSVTRRRREMGIRTALGAAPAGILAQILKEGAVVTGTGLALGLAAALLLARFLTSLLYGVAPHDPAVLAGVTVFLLFVGLLASYLPARRASRVSPLVSLREH